MVVDYNYMMFFFIFIFFTKGTNTLRINEVRIPVHILMHKDARMECRFDLEGDTLYCVKWYKDGIEFFRYLPRDKPPVQLYSLPGVTVEMMNSTPSLLILRSVNLASTGRYHCEVSAEAPSFLTVSDHGDMTVVALPEEGPQITGGRRRYQIGDTVNVNCTSARSKPAAQLTWFINGEQANNSFLRGPETIFTGRQGLETSILGLKFRATPKHFHQGDMKLKCLATIATVYWKSNEESFEGDRPQKTPVLESRESIPPSKSVAGRIQGVGGCVSLYPCSVVVSIHCITAFISAHLFTSCR